MERSLLPGPASQQSEDWDGQSKKRRTISTPCLSETAHEELRDKFSSPKQSDVTDDERQSDEAKHLPTRRSCETKGSPSNGSEHTIGEECLSGRGLQPEVCNSVADLGVIRPSCDDDCNVRSISSEAEETAESDRFEVERVLKHRGRGHHMSYCVKWVGYSETTWEPAENLDDCTTALEEYWLALPLCSV